MQKYFQLFCLIWLTYASSQLNELMEFENIQCENINQMFDIQNELQYWNELKAMDLIQQVSDILEVKESLLNYKEMLLNKQTLTKSSIKVLFQRLVEKEVLKIAQNLENEAEEITLEYCDNTIKEINQILQQRENEKNQLQSFDKSTLFLKLQNILNQIDSCKRELKSVYHNKIIMNQIQTSQQDQVGFGYWLRILSFFPEEYSAEQSFISRVSENVNFNGEDLGDNKLLVTLNKKNLLLSTYDIKTMNSKIDQLISFSQNQWQYIHFSYQEGKAVAFVYSGSGEISKVEFHVEHFKPNLFYFKFGGQDLKLEGFNGQLAQLSYGLGEQYSIFDPQMFNQEFQQLSPKPQFIQESFQLIKEFTEFPSKFELQKFTNSFIDEFAIGAWFRMDYQDLENTEIIRVSDQQKKYALSFFGGNSLSFGSYNKDQPLRKVELFEQTDDWHYIYLSYSYLKEEFSCFVWINGHVIKLIEHEIKHYQTNKLDVQVLSEFKGEILKMNFYLGEGSYITNPQQLPSEYDEGIISLEAGAVRSFQVTTDIPPKQVLAENVNLRKSTVKFQVYNNI